jgi:lysozyme
VRLSDRGLELIKSFEECRLEAFKPTPNDVWTIGWGRTKGVKEGDTCTQSQANKWLEEDIEEASCFVRKMVTVPLTQGEFDALVSWTYNLGGVALRNSTLLKLLNNSDYDGASGQILRWDHQAGQVLAGLTKRRHAEQQLFET